MVGQRNNAITLVAAGGLSLVFDAGRGLEAGLAGAGDGVIGRPDKVFLTRLHSDHVTGLSDLFISGGTLGSSGPLRLWVHSAPRIRRPLQSSLRLGHQVPE